MDGSQLSRLQSRLDLISRPLWCVCLCMPLCGVLCMSLCGVSDKQAWCHHHAPQPRHVNTSCWDRYCKKTVTHQGSGSLVLGGLDCWGWGGLLTACNSLYFVRATAVTIEIKPRMRFGIQQLWVNYRLIWASLAMSLTTLSMATYAWKSMIHNQLVHTPSMLYKEIFIIIITTHNVTVKFLFHSTFHITNI